MSKNRKTKLKNLFKIMPKIKEKTFGQKLKKNTFRLCSSLQTFIHELGI